MEAALPLALQQAIDRNASTSAEQLARDRALFFKKCLLVQRNWNQKRRSLRLRCQSTWRPFWPQKGCSCGKSFLLITNTRTNRFSKKSTEGIRLTGQQAFSTDVKPGFDKRPIFMIGRQVPGRAFRSD